MFEAIIRFLENNKGLTGVFIGAITTLLGSYLGARIQVKALYDINRDESLKTKKDKHWERKYDVLVKLYSNRSAIAEKIEISSIKGNNDIDFYWALNSIYVVYYDSKNVLQKFDKFFNAVTNKTGENQKELLYELIDEMYKDLGLPSLNKDYFMNPFIPNP